MADAVAASTQSLSVHAARTLLSLNRLSSQPREQKLAQTNDYRATVTNQLKTALASCAMDHGAPQIDWNSDVTVTLNTQANADRGDLQCFVSERTLSFLSENTLLQTIVRVSLQAEDSGILQLALGLVPDLLPIKRLLCSPLCTAVEWATKTAPLSEQQVVVWSAVVRSLLPVCKHHLRMLSCGEDHDARLDAAAAGGLNSPSREQIGIHEQLLAEECAAKDVYNDDDLDGDFNEYARSREACSGFGILHLLFLESAKRGPLVLEASHRSSGRIVMHMRSMSTFVTL